MLCNGATIHKVMGGAERDKSGAFCHILSMFSFQSDRGLETLMLDTIIKFMEKHFRFSLNGPGGGVMMDPGQGIRF